MLFSAQLLQKLINRRVLLHSIFWVAMLLIVLTSESWQGRQIRWNYFFQYVVSFFIFIVVSYFNLYILVARFLNKKKILLYILLVVLLVFLGAAIDLLFKMLSIKLNILAANLYGESQIFNLSFFIHTLYGEILFILATTLFFLLDESTKFQEVTINQKIIESEKIHSELNALKSQINPHFLFNTLNSIYSHTLHKSPKAPEMILKLSDLMSYILYDCKEDRVLVSNEVKFIKNYIALEKLRFEDQLHVEVTISENYKDRKIVPLLLIAIVENAFKHGSNTGKSKTYVKVDILIEREFIHLAVKNSISKEHQMKLDKKGIGTENIRKRLELQYSGCHTLIINRNESEYSVELILSDNEN